MKSSGPVFTRQNPFQPASRLGKTHYHPSRKQPLSKKEKKTPKPGDEQDSVLAKYIDRFRHGRPQSRVERQQIDSAIGENQVPFWWMSPSSLPSSSTPAKTTDKDMPLNDEHGFAIFSPAGQHRHDRSLSPCRGSLSILSDTLQGEFDDTEILHLQERANRLLLRDECTLGDGSVHVSSDGLGCSDFSSPVSVYEPVRRPFIPNMIKSTAKASLDSDQIASSHKASVVPSLVPPTRPEEDILFQWRLRRKIEQARDWPQSVQHSSLHGPTFSWHAPSLNNPSASGQAYKQQQSTPELSQKAKHPHIAAPQPEAKEAHTLCPPASGPPPFPAFVVSGSSVSQPQAIAHVPAHMHLLCDVLPCPIKSSDVSRQQNISQSIDESHAKAVHEKTQVTKNSKNNFTDEPIREHTPSPPPGSSAVTEEGKRNQGILWTGNMLMSLALQTGVLHIKDFPKRLCHQQSRQQQRGSQVSSERCTGDYAPPPSPIHSVLGQVVSEVLFPTVDSSPARRTPVSSVSPPCTTPVPPQSSIPTCDAQNSMEVISQLLQEAEDSDEKEFEDDPLLQVLRKQRTWVKEQIGEVDSMLNEFLE
ncbi:Proline and serine-rich protein 3 [Larimichthys crocea]|uniref:Proline and serine-rich protein 3 n=1 Tax=Larimichthys crocea TaxID=215358 RepID=A0A6G0IAV4_LARCR|nr:Proline and serine-rich protein 3 [Larimichthys crocea]